MIKANYHTHTYRCGHAGGEDYEYVEAAIKAGIKTLGFSDHAPYKHIELGYAMDDERLSEYALSINRLKNEYKDKIELHVGLETEYYPEYFDDTVEHMRECGIEYIILGQHSYNEGDCYAVNIIDYDYCVRYVDRICEAMNTGLFTYIAHPDIFGLDRQDKRFRGLIERICGTASDNNMPVEINLLGLWSGRIYPCEEYLRIIGEIGAKAIIGVDAHSPDRLTDKETYKRVFNLCDKYKINLTEDVDITRLAR